MSMAKSPVNWFIVYTASDGEPIALDPAFEGQEYALKMSEEYGMEVTLDIRRVTDEQASKLRAMEWNERRKAMIQILS
jgi:hypothetical protein